MTRISSDFFFTAPTAGDAQAVTADSGGASAAFSQVVENKLAFNLNGGALDAHGDPSSGDGAESATPDSPDANIELAQEVIPPTESNTTDSENGSLLPTDILSNLPADAMQLLAMESMIFAEVQKSIFLQAHASAEFGDVMNEPMGQAAIPAPASQSGQLANPVLPGSVMDPSQHSSGVGTSASEIPPPSLTLTMKTPEQAGFDQTVRQLFPSLTIVNSGEDGQADHPVMPAVPLMPLPMAESAVAMASTESATVAGNFASQATVLASTRATQASRMDSTIAQPTTTTHPGMAVDLKQATIAMPSSGIVPPPSDGLTQVESLALAMEGAESVQQSTEEAKTSLRTVVNPLKSNTGVPSSAAHQPSTLQGNAVSSAPSLNSGQTDAARATMAAEDMETVMALTVPESGEPVQPVPTDETEGPILADRPALNARPRPISSTSNPSLAATGESVRATGLADRLQRMIERMTQASAPGSAAATSDSGSMDLTGVQDQSLNNVDPGQALGESVNPPSVPASTVESAGPKDKKSFSFQLTGAGKAFSFRPASSGSLVTDTDTSAAEVAATATSAETAPDNGGLVVATGNVTSTQVKSAGVDVPVEHSSQPGAQPVAVAPTSTQASQTSKLIRSTIEDANVQVGAEKQAAQRVGDDAAAAPLKEAQPATGSNLRASDPGVAKDTAFGSGSDTANQQSPDPHPGETTNGNRPDVKMTGLGRVHGKGQTRTQLRQQQTAVKLTTEAGEQNAAQIKAGTATVAALQTRVSDVAPVVGKAQSVAGIQGATAAGTIHPETNLNQLAPLENTGVSMQATASHAIPTGSGSLRVEKLQDLMDKLDEHLLSLSKDKDKSMTIQLSPENLGRVAMSCLDQNGGMRVELVVENAAVQNLLKQHEGALRDMLQQAGYRLAQFEVRTQSDGAGSQAQQNRQGQASQDRKNRTIGRAEEVEATSEGQRSYRGTNGRSGVWYVA